MCEEILEDPHRSRVNHISWGCLQEQTDLLRIHSRRRADDSHSLPCLSESKRWAASLLTLELSQFLHALFFFFLADVTEDILVFFLALFEGLRVQMGVPFTERIIQTFMNMFTRWISIYILLFLSLIFLSQWAISGNSHAGKHNWIQSSWQVKYLHQFP